jgi:hypothetical protein
VYGTTNGTGRAGYFYINNASSAADALYVQTSGSGKLINTSSTAYLSNGGVWTNASDISRKENITEVDGASLLAKVVQLPITQWNYKCEGATIKHIGPMAQDFYRLFSLGSDDKSISTIDPAGIALIGIQQLVKENQDLKTKMTDMQKQIDELKAMMKK